MVWAYSGGDSVSSTQGRITLSFFFGFTNLRKSNLGRDVSFLCITLHTEVKIFNLEEISEKLMKKISQLEKESIIIVSFRFLPSKFRLIYLSYF